MRAINVSGIWAAVLLAAVAARAPAGEWWQPQWKCRRPVTVPAQRPTGLPGDDLGVVTFATTGLARDDASDVRVTTAGNVEVPHRVLMTGPVDRVRVAFALAPGETEYFVYFGNPDAGPAAEALEIRRGLLMSTWEYPGGGAGNLDQIRRVFDRASELLGRDFRDRIFLGHNPFGSETRIASHFEGYLVCPRQGRYVFATSSRDSSVLLIDDELVVDNSGAHEPQDDVRKRAGVVLAPGLHKLTFYHVNYHGYPVVVAAWRPPGQTRIQVIPPSAFAPVARGTAGHLERHGEAGVDFLYEHVGEAFTSNRYFERFRFRAALTGGEAPVRRWNWTFGDGTTGEGQEIEHVYLRPGTFRVILTAATASGRRRCVYQVRVSRPWDRVIDHRLDSLESHAAIVARYDFASLRGSALLEAAWLLERTGRLDALASLGEACRTRAAAGETSACRVLPIYADLLLDRGRGAEAAEALEAGAGGTDNASLAAELLLQAGRIRLDELDQPEAAEAVFERIVREYGPLTTAEAVRQARIALGDVWRLRGDREKALAAYREAGPGDLVGGRAVVRGDFARQAEEYLRRADLPAAREVLEKWITRLPEERLEGHASLLLVRLLIAEGRHAEAVREAETLVRVSPENHHAPSLLMLAAEAHRRAGRAEKAADALRRVVEEYPESALAEQAREGLPKR